MGTDALAVPSLGDVNGDGLLDLVVGDCSGFVKRFENIGSSNKPGFGPMEYVNAGGERIFIQAPEGSCQGIEEARWGYVQVKLYDWDGDGLTDLLLSDIHGRNLFYRNSGTRTDAIFDKPLSLVEGEKKLVTRWRCKPTVVERNGRRCYLQTDEGGHITIYEQDKSQGAHVLVRKESLKYRDNTPVKLDSDRQTASFSAKGRIKIEACDWDDDGTWDLIFGVNRISPVAEPYRFASLYVLQNIGTSTEPLFEKPKIVKYKGETINLGVHSCSPAVADIDGDGNEEYVVGDEDGRLRLYQREDLSI
jgi:hypothetical protein